MPMRYYKNMYLGPDLEDGEVDRLKSGVGFHNIFAVCVRPSASNLFEIMSTYELLKEYNQKRDYAIIALFKCKKDAKAAVAEIIKLWLKENDSLAGMKEYYYNNSL